MSSSITITNLNVNYEQKRIIDNLSLEIENGTVTSIVGKSGNGKSTLLKAILGLIKYSGEITTGGQTLSYMPQDLALFDNKTVYANVSLPLVIKDLEVDDKTLMATLEELEIAEYKDVKVRDLSGGQRSRVALARALIDGSNIILLDEPLSSLDYITKQNILEVIKRINEVHRITIMYVTHDIEEALYLSDNILILGNDSLLIRREECTKDKLIKLITQ